MALGCASRSAGERAAGLVAVAATYSSHHTRTAVPRRPGAADGGLGDPNALPATPVETVWLWQAKVDTRAIHALWRSARWNGPPRPGGAGHGGSRLVAVSPAVPGPPPESQSYVGDGWQPLPPPERDDGALIEARDRRQLVWNIEHFVSDDPTRRLHLLRPSRLQLKPADMCICTLHPPCTTARSGSGWIASSTGPRHAPWYSN